MDILTALKTKIGADAGRLNRALSLLAEDPAHTLDELLTLSAEKPPAPEPEPKPKTAPEPSAFSAAIAHFTDPAQRTRAFAHLAEHPKATVAEIEAALIKEDRAALATAQEKITKLEAARAEDAEIITSLRDDGHPRSIRLGSGGGGPRGAEAAFSAEHPNYTERARLFLQDPELARALAEQNGIELFSN